MRPAEASEAVLAGHLGIGDAAVARTSDETALIRRFAARIADDFAKGRMVACDGWMLAETEARLCALLALETEV